MTERLFLKEYDSYIYEEFCENSKADVLDYEAWIETQLAEEKDRSNSFIIDANDQRQKFVNVEVEVRGLKKQLAEEKAKNEGLSRVLMGFMTSKSWPGTFDIDSSDIVWGDDACSFDEQDDIDDWLVNSINAINEELGVYGLQLIDSDRDQERCL